jgi:hypothetical protein
MQLGIPQPQRSGGGFGFFKGVFVGALIVVAYLVGSGAISITPLTEGVSVPAVSPPRIVISTPVSGGTTIRRTVPTAQVNVPALPQPAEQRVIVQQMPTLAMPTALPATPIPEHVLREGATAYALITTPPTVGVYGTNPACNSANATYRTDPVRVEYEGLPIGEVQAWSCVSQEEAVAEHQRLAAELVEKYKREHP